MSRAEILIDAHVHIHSGVAPAAVFDAAAKNMSRLAADRPVSGVLLLTESAGVDAFAALRSREGAWRIEATSEPYSRIARRDEDDMRLIVVAGRQIVTAEGLEVHGFGLIDPIPDGAPAVRAIEQAQAAGAIVALPWGFGKWSGRRGGIVRDLIQMGPKGIFLSDSGARMIGTARPPLFAEAETAGRFVLAGVDPLPLPGAVGKIGRYGVVADLALGDRTPFAEFADWAHGLSASPRRFGRLESPFAFFFAQIAMQARKRLKRSA